MSAARHHLAAQPMPIRVRPRHNERTGSFLIRLATANRCQPWSFLRLLGNIPGGQRSALTPAANISMNGAALTRLAKYSDRSETTLIRCFPSISTAERWPEPTVLIRQGQPKFRRTCPGCEHRAGGARLIPDQDPLKLSCRRHDVWLIAAEPADLKRSPGTVAALTRLARLRRRDGDTVVLKLYNHLREYLTNDWRGFGWHRALVRRWTDRQQAVFGALHNGDEFVRARTHHWSLLPETVALLGLFANPHSARILQPQSGHQRLHAAISRVLDLDDYWTSEENLHATTTFNPLLSNILEQARIGRLTSDPDWMHNTTTNRNTSSRAPPERSAPNPANNFGDRAPTNLQETWPMPDRMANSGVTGHRPPC